MAGWDEVVKSAVEHDAGNMRLAAPAHSNGTAKVTAAV